MGLAAACFYGLFLFVALLNLALMRRLRAGTSPPAGLPCVLIPARNESGKIGPLVAALTAQGARVYVYDDASDDGTGAEALAAGAIVLRGADLPSGWTGKNHACHQLALAASEDFSGDWALFLDADVRVEPGFMSSLAEWTQRCGIRTPVLTGFPKFLPGRGLEPVYLNWVTWILLCTNPFGLVRLTKLGHNAFLNGQIVLWRLSTYMDHLPHQAVKGAVLEDVAIGRLLARRRVNVEVANLSSVISVQMYANTVEAVRGMLKNSSEIAGKGIGSTLLAILLAVIGLGWAAFGWPWSLICLSILGASAFIQSLIVRSRWANSVLIPISLAAGGLTVFWSSFKRSHHGAHWKGRTYQ